MAENQEKKNEEIREFGQIQMKNKISLLTIIGEIEGHDCLPATTKTTKYEHVLPKLAELEDNPDTEGLLLLLNTVGGDVESGRNDRIDPQTNGFISPWRQSFHRCAFSGIDRLFVYCAIRNHGDPSGAHEWNRDWCKTDVRLF